MATLAPGLARKVKKILEIKTDSSDLLSSINTLSGFYDDNTLAARRALRTTIEERGLDINQQFLTAADVVLQALDTMQATLDNLSDSCTVISSRLATTKAAAAPLLAETEALLKEQEAVERRSALVKQFLEQYQLEPQEAEVLQSDEVGSAFFAALERVRTIHENCKVLLRTHHQRAGLELMDLMSMYQESAYEKLCRWVQAECRDIGDFDTPEVAPLLHTAVVALRERPVLYKYCAEEVATARHNALFQRFVTALTRGGPSGLPRPIEIHAHDPKRYTNDMLGWVHQALASEQEFVVALFGADDGQSKDLHYDGESLHCTALLDRIFESICRPLKVRIEQQLMPSPPLLLCFQLEHLLAFYHGMITGVLGEEAQLSQAIKSCWGMAHRVFFEQLKGRGDKLLRTPPVLPADLSPPQQVSETLHILVELMDAHETALKSSAPSEASGEEFSLVLDAVLDPLLEACDRSAEALRRDAPSRVDENVLMDPGRYHMYLINCLCTIQSALTLRPYARNRLQRLAEQVETHVAALVTIEVNGLLAKCGLAEVVDRLRIYLDEGGAMGGVIAADPALALPVVTEAMRGFFASVSAPDALPEFPLLMVPRVRADAAARVGRSLAEAYDMVFSTVEDPRSGYLEQGGATAVKHTPAHVRTILGVI